LPLLPPVVDLTPLPDPPPAYVAPEVAWSEDTLPRSRPDGWLALADDGASLISVRRVDVDTTACEPDPECGGGCSPTTMDPSVPALVLLRRDDLRAGPVSSVARLTVLTPGAEVTLRADGAASNLVVRGAERQPVDLYESCTHQSEVSLRHRAADGRVTDTVVWAGCADSWPFLVWAADLDGDGVPELLLETSQGSGYTRTLWWSDPSHPGAVRLVSTHEVTDC
jgi:hypothetical protein